MRDVTGWLFHALMTINKKGEVIDHKIAETVIKTNRRMTYTNVKRFLQIRMPL